MAIAFARELCIGCACRELTTVRERCDGLCSVCAGRSRDEARIVNELDEIEQRRAEWRQRTRRHREKVRRLALQPRDRARHDDPVQLGMRAIAIVIDIKGALGSGSPLRDTADELSEIVRRLSFGPDD